MEGSNSQTWIMASSALLYLLISNVIALNAPNSISDTGTIQLVQGHSRSAHLAHFVH